MELSENLKNYRMASGLSQKQLSKTLHIARQSISRWELGQATPTEENLAALANVYGVSVDELRYGKGEEDTQIMSALEAPPAVRSKPKKKVVLLIVLAALLVIAVSFAAGWWASKYVQSRTVNEMQIDLSEPHQTFELSPLENN